MGYAGETPIAYMPLSTDATIASAQADGEVRIDILSESGIGEAMFWVMDTEGADDVTLRLHLRGLEGLTITSGVQTIRAGVSSHGDGAVYEASIGADGSETLIEPGSALWAEITPSALVDGMPEYFDIASPPDVLESNGMFRVAWVDFFR